MTIEGIANLIEEQLNENLDAKAFNFSFKIHQEVGDFQTAYQNGMDENLINGVLLESSGDFTPVKEIASKFMNMRLEFAVRQENVNNFKKVLEGWSEAQLGYIYKETETGKTYIITPSAPATGTAYNTSDLDSMVSISLTLEIQITSLGLIGSEAQWTINDEPVNVLRFKILSTRTQQTAEGTEADETTSANQMATVSIMLVIPIAKTTICKDLLNDILSNNKDTIYEIEMDDDFSDGISGRYIMASGEYDGESTKVGAITCNFLKSNEDLE